MKTSCRFDHILCSEIDESGKNVNFYRKKRRLEDEEGYTIIKNEGIYKYAILENDVLKPSNIVYGDKENLTKMKIEKHLDCKQQPIFNSPSYPNKKIEQEMIFREKKAISNRKQIFSNGGDLYYKCN